MGKYQVIHTVVFPLGGNGGNPCPVVLDGDFLTSEEMQEIAKELGHETCFVTKSDLDACEFCFRYFVPNFEIEMCVHATIGSVTVLVKKGFVRKSPLLIETLLGPITVNWETKNDEIEVEVAQFLPEINENVPTIAEICEALNVKTHDVVGESIQSISTSRFKLIIPLTSTTVLHNLKPSYKKIWKLCDQYRITGFYPFAIEDETHKVIQARQFPNKAGYNEDPATGVAASALGAFLYLHDTFPKTETGLSTYHVKQGVAMGKPSYIEAKVYSEKGIIQQTSIKGKAIIKGTSGDIDNTYL